MRMTQNGSGGVGYWTTSCADCPLKPQCTTGKERRIKRWEHEAVIDAVQERLDRTPHAMGTDFRHPKPSCLPTLRFGKPKRSDPNKVDTKLDHRADAVTRSDIVRGL